jgi:GH35 family endo-1,4-beta-xylanase
VPAPWHRELAIEELRDDQLARVQREVETFAGLIDTWDVVNEVMVMPRVSEPMGKVCRAVGRQELVTAAFERAREANLEAILILNENRPDECRELVRACLEADVPIDVLGIQAHMHRGYGGAQGLWDKAERSSDLGVPEHWTETTIVSGRLKTWEGYGRVDDWVSTPEGEERQAREAAEFYRVLFSHPAVEAITWWDFSDHGSWQNAPAGLPRDDMTPKPAYEALRKLIKEDWWTGPLTLKTAADGRVTFRGFLGGYELRAGQATARFSLDTPGEATVTVAVSTDNAQQ